MPVALPLPVFRQIFEFVAEPSYHLDDGCEVAEILGRIPIIPELLEEQRHALKSLSLTCKPFRDMARPLSLRYSSIYSGSELIQLLSTMHPGRPNPIEALIIKQSEEVEAIQDITSPDFLYAMSTCFRLWALKIENPLLAPSRFPHALHSLTVCGTLSNITRLDLVMHQYDEEPNARLLSQVLLLMPKLIYLHVDRQGNQIFKRDPDFRHPELPPPPFRLQYLSIPYGYFDLHWLTSTSHNTLKLAHFVDRMGSEPLLNLDRPWTALRHLHIIGIPEYEVMFETLRSCLNLVGLAMNIQVPTEHAEQLYMIQCFDALSCPLTDFTIIWEPSFSVYKHRTSYQSDNLSYDLLTSAILYHPKLARLETVTVEVESEYHEPCEDSMTSVQKTCKERDILFSIICPLSCSQCNLTDPYRDFDPDTY